MKKTLYVLALAALLGVLPAQAQVDFSRYVALGDSLTAGFVSGGLVERYQNQSYPALFADQIGAPTFEMPIVSEPGLPNLLQLWGLVPAPQIAPIPGPPGSPVNATYPAPYDNLGVPGSTVYDLLTTTGDINNLLAGNTDNVMHDMILRFPVVENPGGGAPIPATALVQGIGLAPTFATMWIGNNDVLPAAVTATPIEGITMTPVSVFQDLYFQALGALASSGADIVVMKIAGVTGMAFVTTVSNYLDVPGLGTVQLMGEYGPIGDDDFITLGASSLIAQGYGLPGQPPLPEDLNPATGAYGVIIRAAEMQVIEDQVAAYNQIIEEAAAQFGAHVFDTAAVFADVHAHGWHIAGFQFTTDFLTGGLFSYDGVHLQNIGYALVASKLIDFVNETFGASVPQVNMSEIMCNGDCAGNGVPPGTDVKSVVFSDAAFERLKEVFPIHLNPVTEQQTQTYAVD